MRRVWAAPPHRRRAGARACGIQALMASRSLPTISSMWWRSAMKAGALGALLVGAASGVLNGVAGIGGPPAIVFYFATTGTAVSRATLIAYFLFTDVYALAWAGGTGLLSTAAWPLIVVALPFSLLGIWLGQRGFERLDAARAAAPDLGPAGGAGGGWCGWGDVAAGGGLIFLKVSSTRSAGLLSSLASTGRPSQALIRQPMLGASIPTFGCLCASPFLIKKMRNG